MAYQPRSVWALWLTLPRMAVLHHGRGVQPALPLPDRFWIRHVDGLPRGEGEQLINGQGVKGFVSCRARRTPRCGVHEHSASATTGCCASTTGSSSYTSTAAKPGRPLRSAATRAPAAIIGARLVSTSSAVGCMRCQIIRRDDATGLAVARQVQAQHSACSKRFAAGSDLEALGLRTGRRALATRAHDVHAKRSPYARHGCADMAEGVHAEGTPEQACTDCGVPMAVFEALHFIGKMAE